MVSEVLQDSLNRFSLTRIGILTFPISISVLDSIICALYWMAASIYCLLIRESMTEAEIEIVIHRAPEMFPGVRLRIISDNGPQFIGNDFQPFRLPVFI